MSARLLRGLVTGARKRHEAALSSPFRNDERCRANPRRPDSNPRNLSAPIDPEQRAELEAWSLHNVLGIDLTVGDDPYAHAAQLLDQWAKRSVIVHDEQAALWPLEQDYTGPDGQVRTGRRFVARVRARSGHHERTQHGPKEARLTLTRATVSRSSACTRAPTR